MGSYKNISHNGFCQNYFNLHFQESQAVLSKSEINLFVYSGLWRSSAERWLLETLLRGRWGAVTLGKWGHAAGALQAGLKGPLVWRFQRVVESVGLSWKVVPQTPVGPERYSRKGREQGRRWTETNIKEGEKRWVRREVERWWWRRQKRGIKRFRSVRYLTVLVFYIITFSEMSVSECLCGSYLRASTLASESASRIPFLMLSTRTAVCLQGRDMEV